MTYNVFGGMLNLLQQLYEISKFKQKDVPNMCACCMLPPVESHKVYAPLNSTNHINTMKKPDEQTNRQDQINALCLHLQTWPA